MTISFTSLTKRYRGVTAVDDLSVDVQPGRVTAFLGRQRGGQDDEHADPARHCPHRRAGRPRSTASATPTFRTRCASSVPCSTRASTRIARRATTSGGLTRRAGVPPEQADELLDRFGIGGRRGPTGRRVPRRDAPAARARLRPGRRPLGPRPRRAAQRPRPGRDPRGCAAFLRSFADRAAGRCFLSSHLLQGGGGASPTTSSSSAAAGSCGPAPSATSSGRAASAVTTRDAAALSAALVDAGATVDRTGPDGLLVHGADGATIAAAAVRAGALVTGLQEQSADLESVFQALVHDSQEVLS